MMQLQDGLFAGNALYYLAALALVLLVSGGVGFLAQRDRPAARMRGLAVRHGGPGGPSLAKIAEETPRGLARALIPEDPSERAQIQFQHRIAGNVRARRAGCRHGDQHDRHHDHKQHKAGKDPQHGQEKLFHIGWKSRRGPNAPEDRP